MRRATCALLAALVLVGLHDPAARAHAQAAEPFPVVAVEPAKSRSHTWAYLALAGGAGLIGASFVFSSRADDAYAGYLESSDPDEIQQLYDRAIHNDHLAQASLLTGELLVATGLYLRFIRRPAPKKVSVSLLPSRCAISYRF